MVVQDPAHLAGRRQGAAGHDGVAADQPPAGLPGLRQGRRVPAAEPGDVQRPRRDPVRRASSATYPKPIADLQPGPARPRALRALRRAAPGSPTQIAGDPFIELLERGALRAGRHLRGRAVRLLLLRQHRPDLPGRRADQRAYRFRARPFDLVSTPSVCEHCAAGCARAPTTAAARSCAGWPATTRRSTRSGTATRAASAFRYATANDRLTTPLVRDADGELQPGVLAGGAGRRRRGRARRRARPAASACCPAAGSPSRTPTPTRKFARVALGTNDIDFRARAALGRGGGLPRARTSPAPGSGVTYADLEHAPAVLLVGFEPEEESPIVFLRLRKAVRTRRARRSSTVAPFATPRLREAVGHACSPPRPGAEAAVAAARWPTATCGRRRPPRRSRAAGAVDPRRRAARRGRPARSRRWSRSPQATGARLAWVPRRAGERGASRPARCRRCCPAAARSPTPRPAPSRARPGASTDAARAAPGRDTDGDPRRGARRASSARCVVGGVDPADLPDPAAAAAALDGVAFVVCLEMRPSRGDRARRRRPPGRRRRRRRPAPSSTGRAGRARSTQALHGTGALPDARVLHALADEMDVDLRLPDARGGRAPSWPRSARWRRRARRRAGSTSGRRRRPTGPPARPCWPPGGSCSTSARLQDGEPYLAGTARPPVARLVAGDRRRRSASPTATGSRCRTDARRDHPAGRGSPRCPTGWSGCRRTRRAATVRARRSAPTPAPSCASRRRPQSGRPR